MIRNSIVLLLLLFSFSKNFGQASTVYSDAMTEVEDYMQSNDYEEALPILMHLNKTGNTSYNVSYCLGICYTHLHRNYDLAIKYLLNACDGISYTYNANYPSELKAPVRALFDLGDAYRMAEQWNDAINAFKKFQKRIPLTDLGTRQTVERRIRECEYAKMMMLKPIKAIFISADSKINNGNSNSNACISGDGRTMVFLRAMKFYNAIFITHKLSDTCNCWSDPQEITARLGIDGDFVPTGLNDDGSSMLLTGFSVLTGNDIFESKYQKGKWSKVRKLSNPISTSFNDEDAVYGPNGNSIYFSSNREHGMGGYDIYKCSKDSAGNWGNVVNMGAPINSAFDERSPAILDDGKMIIFSSNAGNGMGGYDFYYSHLNDSGKFTTIFNIGFPFNTAGDDLGYKPCNHTGDGVLTRFNSKKNGQSEILFVHCDSFSSFRSVPVKGKIKIAGKQKFQNPVEVDFIDKYSGDTIEKRSLTSDDYQVLLYPGDFQIHVENQGDQSLQISSDTMANRVALESNFEFQTENEQPDSLPEFVNKISTDIVYDTIFVSDILFNFNQYAFSNQENANLDILTRKLIHYKDIKIFLAGYSDAIGDSIYNKLLSLRRAEYVKNRLIAKGLEASRISTEGYGSINFIANNKFPNGTDNPKGRAINRRVEIHLSGVNSSVKIILKSRMGNPL